MLRASVVVVSLVSGVLAQEHAYRPDQARLVVATPKWLLWRPDDHGASLADKQARKRRKDVDAVRKELQRRVVRLGTVLVLQRADNAAHLRVVRDGPGILSCPLTVMNDGTVVLANFERDVLRFVDPKGAMREARCTVEGQRASICAAYPDGVVAQVPGLSLDDVSLAKQDVTLYWIAWRDGGLKGARPWRMTTARSSRFSSVRVARHKDRFATRAGVYDLAKERWRPFARHPVRIQSFDGRYAIGSDSVHAVRAEDRRAAIARRPYFAVRHGIVYWMEESGLEVKIIRARPVLGNGQGREIGRTRLFNGLQATAYVRNNIWAVARLGPTERPIVYWTDRGLCWSDGKRWRSHAWLKPSDFK